MTLNLHEQYEILKDVKSTPANIMVAFALEEEDPQEKKQKLDSMIPHLEKLNGKTPPCISHLINKGGSAALGTYDKNNLTVVTFCNSYGTTIKKALVLGEALAKNSVNGPVETTKTHSEKIKHFRSIMDSPSTKNTPFNCSFMLSARKELRFSCKKCPARPSGGKCRKP